MSTKKLALVLAILLLLVGIVYSGYLSEKKIGTVTSVVESPTNDMPDVAAVPGRKDHVAAELRSEEAMDEEEIIMSTSAGVAKRANAAKALEADSGN